MRKFFSMLFGVGSVLFLTSAMAHAQTFNLRLSGAQENPANASPGTGVATITLDQPGSTLGVNFSFAGLQGNTTAAHIHCCAGPGTNAGVATTTPTFAGTPLGVTSGALNITLDLNAAGSYNPAFVTAQGGLANAKAALIAGILGGTTYLNIHTNIFPGGEIRAQIVPDATAPSITCPNSLTKFVDPGQVTALVTLTPPPATDNVLVQSVVGSRSDGQPLNAPFPIGITIVSWTATDTTGNTATCFQSIGVLVPSGSRRNP